MIVAIILWSISTKVWDQAGIELTTTGFAVGHATDCDMGLDIVYLAFSQIYWV